MADYFRLFLRGMLIMLWLFSLLFFPSFVASTGKYILNGSMVIITSPPAGDGTTAAAGASTVKWLDFAVPRDRSVPPIITVNQKERLCVQSDNLEELLRTFNGGQRFASREGDPNARRYVSTSENERLNDHHQDGVFVNDNLESATSSYMEIFLDGWIRLYPLAIVVTCMAVFATIGGVLLYIHVMTVMQGVYERLDLCFTDPMMDAYIIKPGLFGTDPVMCRATARRRAEERKGQLQRLSPGAVISPLRIGNLQEWKKDMDVRDGKNKTDPQLSGAWRPDLNRWMHILTKGKLGKNTPFLFNRGTIEKQVEAHSNDSDNEMTGPKNTTLDSDEESNTASERLETDIDQTNKWDQEARYKAESNTTTISAQTVTESMQVNIASMDQDQELDRTSSSLVKLLIGYVLSQENNNRLSHQKIVTRSQSTDNTYNKSGEVPDGLQISGRKEIDQVKDPGKSEESFGDSGRGEMKQAHGDIQSVNKSESVTKPMKGESFGDDRIESTECMVQEMINTRNDDSLTANTLQPVKGDTAACVGNLMSEAQQTVLEKQASSVLVKDIDNNTERPASEFCLETRINKPGVCSKTENSDPSDLCETGVFTKHIRLCESKQNVVITEFAESDKSLVNEQDEIFDLNLVQKYVDGILRQAVDLEKHIEENGLSDQTFRPNLETAQTPNISTNLEEEESAQLTKITEVKTSLLEINKQVKHLRREIDEYYQSEAYRCLCNGEDELDETLPMNETAIFNPQFEALGIQSLIMETHQNLNHLQRVKNSVAITVSKSCGNAFLPKLTQVNTSLNIHKLSIQSAQMYVENYTRSDRIVKNENSNEK